MEENTVMPAPSAPAPTAPKPTEPMPEGPLPEFPPTIATEKEMPPSTVPSPVQAVPSPVQAVPSPVQAVPSPVQVKVDQTDGSRWIKIYPGMKLSAPKTPGPNGKCTCGSGRKFKKCHGR